MKTKRNIRIAISITATAVILFLLPMLIWNIMFRGIEGYYEGGTLTSSENSSKVRLFFELSGTNFYRICPSHRSRSNLGPIKVFEGYCELNHCAWGIMNLEIKDNQIASYAPKVRNPWRIWLRWVFGKTQDFDNAKCLCVDFSACPQ